MIPDYNYLRIRRFLLPSSNPIPESLKTTKKEKSPANSITLEGYAHLFQKFLNEPIEICGNLLPELKIPTTRRELFSAIVNKSPVPVIKIKLRGGYLHHLLDDFYRTKTPTNHEKLPLPTDSDIEFIFERKHELPLDELNKSPEEVRAFKKSMRELSLDELNKLREDVLSFIEEKCAEKKISLENEDLRNKVLRKNQPYYKKHEFSNDRYSIVNLKLTKDNIPEPDLELLFKSHQDTKGMFTFDWLSTNIFPMLENENYIPILKTKSMVTCEQAIRDWMNRELDSPPGTLWGLREWMRLLTFQKKEFQLKNPVVEKEVIDVLLENDLKGELVYPEFRKNLTNHLKSHNTSLDALVISTCHSLQQASDKEKSRACIQDILNAYIKETGQSGFKELVKGHKRLFVELVLSTATPVELEKYLPELTAPFFDCKCLYLPKTDTATFQKLFRSFLSDVYSRKNITDGLRFLPLLSSWAELPFDPKTPKVSLPPKTLFWLLGIEIDKSNLAVLKERKSLLKALTERKVYPLECQEAKDFRIQLATAFSRIKDVQAKSIIRQFHHLESLHTTPKALKDYEALKKSFQTLSTALINQKEWNESDRKTFELALPTMLATIPKVSALLSEHFKAAQGSTSFSDDLAFILRILPAESRQTLVNGLIASIKKVESDCGLWDEILSLIPAYIKTKTHSSIASLLLHIHQKVPRLKEAIREHYHEMIKACPSEREKRNLILATWKMAEDYLGLDKAIAIVENSLVSEIRSELSNAQLQQVENELKKLPFETTTLWPRLFKRMEGNLHADKISEWLWIGETKGFKKADIKERTACWMIALNSLPNTSVRKFLDWGLKIRLFWGKTPNPELSALTTRLVERCFDFGLPSESEEKDFQSLINYAKDCQAQNLEALNKLHSICSLGYRGKEKEPKNLDKAKAYFFANHPIPAENQTVIPYPKKDPEKIGMEDLYHDLLSTYIEETDKLLEMRKTYFPNADLLKLVKLSHNNASLSTLKNLIEELFGTLKKTKMNEQAISICNSALASVAAKQSYRDEQDFENIINHPALSLFATNNYIAGCRQEVLPKNLRTQCQKRHKTPEEVTGTLSQVIDFAKKHDKPFLIERWLPHIARKLTPEDFIKVLATVKGTHTTDTTKSFMRAIAKYMTAFHNRIKDPVKTLEWLDEILYVPWIFCEDNHTKISLASFYKTLKPQELCNTHPLSIYRMELHFDSQRYLGANDLTTKQKAQEMERTVKKRLAIGTQIPFKEKYSASVVFGLGLVETTQTPILNLYPAILKRIYEAMFDCAKTRPFFEVGYEVKKYMEDKLRITETLIKHNLMKVGDLLVVNIKNLPEDCSQELHIALQSLVCSYVDLLCDSMEKQLPLPSNFAFQNLERLAVCFLGHTIQYLDFSKGIDPSSFDYCSDKLLPLILTHTFQKEKDLLQLKNFCEYINRIAQASSTATMKAQAIYTIAKLIEHSKIVIQNNKIDDASIINAKVLLDGTILECYKNGILTTEGKDCYQDKVLLLGN